MLQGIILGYNRSLPILCMPPLLCHSRKSLGGFSVVTAKFMLVLLKEGSLHSG